MCSFRPSPVGRRCVYRSLSPCWLPDVSSGAQTLHRLSLLAPCWVSDGIKSLRLWRALQADVVCADHLMGLIEIVIIKIDNVSNGRNSLFAMSFSVHGVEVWAPPFFYSACNLPDPLVRPMGADDEYRILLGLNTCHASLPARLPPAVQMCMNLTGAASLSSFLGPQVKI